MLHVIQKEIVISKSCKRKFDLALLTYIIALLEKGNKKQILSKIYLLHQNLVLYIMCYNRCGIMMKNDYNN